MYDFSVNVGQPEVSPLVSVGELLVVDAKAMQHGRVQIMNVNRLVDNVVAEIIGFAVDNTRFDTATCHPFGVATWMMVTTVIGFRQATLAIDRSAKFSAPDYEGIIKHATLLEIV